LCKHLATAPTAIVNILSIQCTSNIWFIFGVKAYLQTANFSSFSQRLIFYRTITQ